MSPPSDSSPELSFCVSTSKACVAVTSMHDVASSFPVETKAEWVLSLDTKFLTFSRQPGVKGDFSTSEENDGRAEVYGWGAIKPKLGGAKQAV